MEYRWPEYMNQITVGRYVDLTYKAITRRVKRGSFPPPIKLGRSNRWRRKDIDQWMKEMKEKGERR